MWLPLRVFEQLARWLVSAYFRAILHGAKKSEIFGIVFEEL